MKRFLLIVVLFIGIIMAANAVFAEDDLWDNFGDQNAYGQKAVSDEEFEQTLDALKQRKYGKQKNKDIPKGASFRQSNETNFINNVPDELPILCIPAELQIDEDSIIPIGHYQIVGEMLNGEPVIKLYQSHYLIAQLQACETLDDFNKTTINFVDLLQEDDNKVKIIFGNVDFNAYSIVDIAPLKTGE